MQPHAQLTTILLSRDGCRKRPSAAAPQRALDADMAWCCPEHHISGESALRALLPLSGWGLSEVSGVPGPTSGLWESNRMSLQAWA